MAMNPNVGFNPPPLQTPIIQQFSDAKDGLFSSVSWSAWFNLIFQRISKLGILYDTNANIGNYAAGRYSGFFYYKTDRKVLYASNGTTWNYMAGEMPVTQATLPAASTLSVLDNGLLAQITDFNHKLKWSAATLTGAVWAAGSATLTVANNAVIGQTVVVEGVLPAGYDGVFVLTGVTATTVTYVVANPGAYVSGGALSLWGWAPGEEGSGKGPVLFEVDPSPATGWHLYDGTANVPYLKSDGTTGLVTLPDLVSASGKAAYMKAGSPNGAVVVASATGVDSGAGTVVAAGAGATVATHTHTHAAPGEPQNLIRRPWFRC
jgi:hypothetical protein